MKEVMIIIRPNMYFKTKEALVKAGFSAMVTKEVLGRGKKSVELCAQLSNREKAVGMDTIAKKLIEIVVRDEDVDSLVAAIMSVNSTGHAGDGKIFVSPVDDVRRIRTGERAEDAIM